MNSIIGFYVFLFGLCIGSFLNVVILRGLSGEDFIFSRSKCPKCKNQLKWYMNIPLISYIFLKGKCAFCKEKISIQYPIIEFITGCAFLGSYLAFGLTLKTLFVCIILSLFIVLAVTDILETVIISHHAYILLAVALIYSVFYFGINSLTDAALSALYAYVLMELIALFGTFFIGMRAFGDGDSYIALGLGALFGIKNFAIIILLSILLMFVVSIFPFIINLYKEQKDKFKLFLIIFISLIAFILMATYITDDNLKLCLMLPTSIIIIAMLLKSLKQITFEENDNNNNDNDKSVFYYLAKRLFKNIKYILIGLALILTFVLLNIYIDNILLKNILKFILLFLFIFTLYRLNKNFYENIENGQNFDTCYEKVEKECIVMPFGPAMLIAGTLGIFHLEQIKMAIKMFLY